MARRFPRAVVLAALLLAACGGAGEPRATPTGPVENGGEAEEAVVMRDFSFEPRDPVVRSGGTVELDNRGNALHNFSIEGTEFDVDVRAGESTTVTVDVEPGEYPLVCRYHVPQNMVGTITVGG